MAQRIKTLMIQNHRLIFWFSNAMLLATAPAVFVASASLGLFIATNNHFGLKKTFARHIPWDTVAGIISTIVFVCELIFRNQIQYLWGGLLAGSYVYSIWSGHIHGKKMSGLRALEHEMDVLTNEFTPWVKGALFL